METPLRPASDEVITVQTALAAEFEVGRGVESAASPHIHHPTIPFVAFHLDITAQQWTMPAGRRAMMASSKGESGGGQHPHA